MLDVVTTSFYIKAAGFEKNEFEHYSTALFDEWDSYIESHLDLTDYAVTLVIEEGSIKGAGKIAATAGVLYLAIGNYGSFISGVQTIREQASYVTNALFDQAKGRFGCKTTRGNSNQSGGEIFYLKNLFERVQRGQATPDQAVAEVQDRCGQDAASSPDFLRDLATSLAKAPRLPEQLPITGEFWEPCEDIKAPERKPKAETTARSRNPHSTALQNRDISSEEGRLEKGHAHKAGLAGPCTLTIHVWTPLASDRVNCVIGKRCGCSRVVGLGVSSMCSGHDGNRWNEATLSIGHAEQKSYRLARPEDRLVCHRASLGAARGGNSVHRRAIAR